MTSIMKSHPALKGIATYSQGTRTLAAQRRVFGLEMGDWRIHCICIGERRRDANSLGHDKQHRQRETTNPRGATSRGKMARGVGTEGVNEVLVGRDGAVRTRNIDAKIS